MSSSARRIKLQLPAPKPRNPLVAPASQRKAGSHRKGKAAERQQQQKALRKALREL